MKTKTTVKAGLIDNMIPLNLIPKVKCLVDVEVGTSPLANG